MGKLVSSDAGPGPARPPNNALRHRTRPISTDRKNARLLRDQSTIHRSIYSGTGIVRPSVWNSLPDPVRNPNSTEAAFRRPLYRLFLFAVYTNAPGASVGGGVCLLMRYVNRHAIDTVAVYAVLPQISFLSRNVPLSNVCGICARTVLLRA